MERIVLAYSGGLDTSVAIAWLAEHYGAEVIAVTLDLGQGRELTDVRERALAVGATRAHVLDVREEFAHEYILPALQAGALYEDRYPLAPARVWGMSRPEEIEYAKARRIPIPSTIDSPYTVDANLWGRSIERGVLEDIWQESPEEIYALTRAPLDCPNEPAYIEIGFEQGAPVRANGIEMPLVELIESLETIAGAHGVG